ncbi:MAG: hypothetical protein M3Q33_07450 [Acidobacteriota bacterium]|nr:hypothetical protein [Acidobacteriota bacterium]
MGVSDSQGFFKTVYKGKLRERGGFRFSRRAFTFSYFEIRVFSDFAQSAKRVADLAVSCQRGLPNQAARLAQ